MLMLMINNTLKGLGRYRRYRQTRAALAVLPVDSCLDLDIYDIDDVARRAVWG